jgi:plasmid stability protein
MGSILVRGLDQKTIERLKEHARLDGHSLQPEVKALLKRAAETFTMPRHEVVAAQRSAHRRSGVAQDQRREVRGAETRKQSRVLADDQCRQTPRPVVQRASSRQGTRGLHPGASGDIALGCASGRLCR